ncbi:hypothetical protein O3P69_009315 [Scylla paramamosain]|uniref:NADH dehydrogenase [ubiquinone] 1 beta subcomplex subunit 1 n=1 Tax=Scylla paramamosain TaxID=85552 RepID=A0AAW0TA25_SCYPA
MGTPLFAAAAITADLWSIEPAPFYSGVVARMFFNHVKIDRKLMLGILVPLTGYYLGSLLDRTETNRLVMFRDKSALYGRELAPGEKPSWP